MTSRHYRLPSLHALATFEAAARHRSVKRAADELNVTPGAVGRQIRALEEELGSALFDRNQSALNPTAEGAILYRVLSDTFARLGDAVGTIRLGRRQDHLTVACTHAFARCWLMPRMKGFWEKHPDVCVDHIVSDDGRDYRRSEVDLRIRYGFGAWPDEASIRLFGDVLYPVAAPAFAERHAGATPADLPKIPLLHVDWVDPDWTGWGELLRRGEIEGVGARGRRFSNFDVALQACKDGQGVAVGWHRLVEPLVASGQLVRFTSLTAPAPGGYHLTWNVDRGPKGAAAAFRDWLLGEVGEPRPPAVHGQE